jgi:hypothetical protein
LILYSKILHRTSKFLSHRIIKLNAIRLMLVARTGEYSYVQRSWCWCWVWAVRHQVGKIGIVGNCGLEIYGALLRTSLAGQQSIDGSTRKLRFQNRRPFRQIWMRFGSAGCETGATERPQTVFRWFFLVSSCLRSCLPFSLLCISISVFLSSKPFTFIFASPKLRPLRSPVLRG